jgi:thiol-disulfide isomerase/thioredoxin
MSKLKFGLTYITVRLFLFYILLTFSRPAYSQADNEKAPLINVTNWISPSKQIVLKNKFIVLDFWATWCAPCLAAIPHLNDLQKQLGSDKEIVFLSMSDESVEKINKILPRFKFN